MKKAPKIALISLAALVALVLVAALVALLSLDSAVKAVVEKGGSYALKVPVKLDSARVSLFGGSAELRKFEIANPPGFKTPRAVYFGEIAAKLKISSLNKDVVEIPEVIIRQPEISIEGDLKAGSNLQKLIKNLDETLGPSGKSAEPGPAKPTEPGAGKKLRIGRILIENAKVSMGATFLGGEATSVTVPKIELKDLGSGPEGITTGEVIKKVLSEILVQASKSGGKAGDALRGLTSQAGIASEVGEQIKETGKGLIEGVKGLFKKKDPGR